MTDGIETQKEDNDWKDATQTIVGACVRARTHTRAHAQIDHDYYELIANPPSAYLFNYYWHELYNAPVLTHATEEHVLHNFTFESLLRSKTVEPEELKDSYRRAVVCAAAHGQDRITRTEYKHQTPVPILRRSHAQHHHRDWWLLLHWREFTQLAGGHTVHCAVDGQL